MKYPGRFALAAALLLTLVASERQGVVHAAGGPVESANNEYRVLAPIESGNLLLFPVVRAGGKSGAPGATPFLTLDEGIKTGEVEVTEAGKVRGLIRRRGSASTTNTAPIYQDTPRGDQVNTLVLVNNSKQPLLLLAGEIVTGGKQDRVIAKDRIVPAGGDPIDLSVFCIEHGRWTESSATFNGAAKGYVGSFMVQPTIRQKAMVAKNQQQVWDSVHGTITQMEVAAAPPVSAGNTSETVTVQAQSISPNTLATTSYAKVMQDRVVSEKVDEAAAPVMKSRDQVFAQLRQEHAVGVVVAVRGEIVWADIFADTELLSRYWTKLVRSYAAESLTTGETHSAPNVTDAQHFLDAPSGGTETSESDVAIYRYRELHFRDTETFVLQSLLPGTGYDVHISKLKLVPEESGIEPLQRFR
jgi:hypothetical protein